MSETKEKDRKRDSSDTDREGQFRRRARASTCGEGGAQAGGTSAVGRAQVDELTPRNMTTSVLPLLFLRISSQPFFVMMAVTRGFTSWTSLRVRVLLSRRTAMAPQRPSPSPSPLHTTPTPTPTAQPPREAANLLASPTVVKASPLEIGSEPCEVRHLSFLIRRIFGVQLLDTDLTLLPAAAPPPLRPAPQDRISTWEGRKKIGRRGLESEAKLKRSLRSASTRKGSLDTPWVSTSFRVAHAFEAEG